MRSDRNVPRPIDVSFNNSGISNSQTIMPTYEYQCKTCGHRFDYFQSISSDPLTHCPVEECIQEDPARKGTGEVVRRISAGAGLVFKGEGFYLTDYARKKTSPSGSGSRSSSESKSEGTKGESGGGESGSSSSDSKKESGGSSGSSSSSEN